MHAAFAKPRGIFMPLTETTHRDTFVDVVSELSFESAVGHAQEAFGAANSAVVQLNIGNADVRLTHADPAAAQFTAEYDFGALPIARRHEALLQLLELNTLSVHERGLAVGIDANTDCGVAVESIPIAGLVIQGLRRRLVDAGQLGVTWLSAWHPQADDDGW
jgi:hypothetical protein